MCQHAYGLELPGGILYERGRIYAGRRGFSAGAESRSLWRRDKYAFYHRYTEQSAVDLLCAEWSGKGISAVGWDVSSDWGGRRAADDQGRDAWPDGYSGSCAADADDGSGRFRRTCRSQWSSGGDVYGSFKCGCRNDNARKSCICNYLYVLFYAAGKRYEKKRGAEVFLPDASKNWAGESDIGSYSDADCDDGIRQGTAVMESGAGRGRCVFSESDRQDGKSWNSTAPESSDIPELWYCSMQKWKKYGRIFISGKIAGWDNECMASIRKISEWYQVNHDSGTGADDIS